MALTVPIFLSYRMHVVFLILKLHLGGGPRQVVQKQQKKLDMKPIEQGSSTQGAPGDHGPLGNHHQHTSEEQIQE
ncbi:unnamed protein product [Miscanthus lutarioriparius]|uniref:Uncharacterized protein n=1 Tax=Miscanthus lutarioriparius TaxID=422564 RepID=A0A811NU14_9POAL|nr:unnamed protein product [Miscanthus lutarioriparius]